MDPDTKNHNVVILCEYACLCNNRLLLLWNTCFIRKKRIKIPISCFLTQNKQLPNPKKCKSEFTFATKMGQIEDPILNQILKKRFYHQTIPNRDKEKTTTHENSNIATRKSREIRIKSTQITKYKADLGIQRKIERERNRTISIFVEQAECLLELRDLIIGKLICHL